MAIMIPRMASIRVFMILSPIKVKVCLMRFWHASSGLGGSVIIFVMVELRCNIELSRAMTDNIINTIMNIDAMDRLKLLGGGKPNTYRMKITSMKSIARSISIITCFTS